MRLASRRAIGLGLVLGIAALVLLLLHGQINHMPVPNPDPNHLHADFAIWVSGKQMEFSDPKYMTTEEQEEALPASSPRKYLHLHDENWHVLHIHKPGQILGTFLQALDLRLQDMGNQQWCISAIERSATCGGGPVRLFVNGAERSGNPGMYVLQDTDHLLLTDAISDLEVTQQLLKLTDNACLYSKTCPWRGQPPSEKCIADPSVPCRL